MIILRNNSIRSLGDMLYSRSMADQVISIPGLGVLVYVLCRHAFSGIQGLTKTPLHRTPLVQFNGVQPGSREIFPTRST